MTIEYNPSVNGMPNPALIFAAAIALHLNDEQIAQFNEDFLRIHLEHRAMWEQYCEELKASK